MNCNADGNVQKRTGREVAFTLGVDSDAVYHWIRQQGWATDLDPGDEPWLSPDQAVQTYEHFLRSMGPGHRLSLTSRRTGELDGFVRAELTILPGREEDPQEEITLQIDEPMGLDSSDIVDDLIAWFGLGDSYHVQEVTNRTQWGGGSAGFSAVLEVAAHLWEPVASGIVSYAVGKIVQRLREIPKAQYQMTEAEALEHARYRVAIREGKSVGDLHPSKVTTAVEDGFTTFTFDFEISDSVDVRVSITAMGSVRITRIRRGPE